LIAVDKKEITMKKYLFGLGAMLVGAGLMFVLMHGEVSAESEDADKFTCSNGEAIIIQSKGKKFPIAASTICTSRGLTCVFSLRTGENGPAGVSCVKSGMFR
jgi:hypothetical protein